MSANSRVDVKENNIALLEQTLLEEAAEYRALVSLTEQEQEALMSNDLQGLEQTIREKETLLAKVATWAGKRENLTTTLAAMFGLAANATLTDILSHIEETSAQKMITLREEFIELVERLISLNYTNKMILQTELVRVDSTFQYITTTLSEPANGYTARGSSKNSAGKNILNWQI